MSRIRLINFRGVPLTPDAVAALKDVETTAIKKGRWALEILGPEYAFKDRELSLIPGGREVHLRLHREDVTDPEVELRALWGLAVPRGFVPWLRHCTPTGTPQDRILHFLGPWTALYERLHAEGRGHLAWRSVCCAAAVEVGEWKGDREKERFIQAQLHRLGHNIGPVDGVVGERTKAALQRLSLFGTLENIYEALRDSKDPGSPPTSKPLHGHIVVPGREIQVRHYGEVASVAMGSSGARLSAKGRGRFIVDVGGPL